MFRNFVQFFKILIFWVVRGVRGQKTVQNNKNFCPSRFIFQEPYIIWLSFMVQLCKMIIPPVFSFIFSKFCFFGLLGEGKKLSKTEKIWLSHSISQELYILWLSFMVHICKVIIYSGGFFIFGLLGGKSTKNGPKWQRILSHMFVISGSIHHMIVIYICYTCIKW